MAITIGIVILVLLIGFFAFIGTRPARFRIERSALVSAPAEVIFPLLNDFHQWVRWSPYEKLDPNMKKSFEGPANGPGAVYIWSGNNKAGEGQAMIQAIKPGELVALELKFVRPFVATNQASFLLEPAPGGTRVTWRMDGKNNFMGKAMSVIMNIDALVGKDFEEGLANLNKAAQTTTEAQRLSS